MLNYYNFYIEIKYFITKSNLFAFIKMDANENAHKKKRGDHT